MTITEVKPRREKLGKREEPREMLKDKAMPDIPLGMERELTMLKMRARILVQWKILTESLLNRDITNSSNRLEEELGIPGDRKSVV